jgi:iron(III) transport system permease protein
LILIVTETRRRITLTSLQIILLVPAIMVFGYVFVKMPVQAFELLHEINLWNYLGDSLTVAVSAIVIAFAIAIIPAWLTDAYSFRGRQWAVASQLFPLTVPAYISTLLYSEIQPRDLLVGRLALSLTVGVATAPWMFLFLRVALARIPRGLVETARTLGLRPWQRVMHLYVPLTAPFALGAMVLVGIQAASDFDSANALGVPTFSVGLYRQWFALQRQDLGFVMAAVPLLLLLVGLVPAIYLLNFEGAAGSTFQSVARAPTLANAGKTCVIHLACFAAALPGFFLPLAIGGFWSLQVLGRVPLTSLYHDALSSIFTAVLTTGLCLVSALGVASLSLWGERSGWNERMTWLVLVNFLIPPMVMGLIFLQLSRSEVLQNTRWAIVVAQTARFLPFALIPLTVSASKIPAMFMDSARSLGCTAAQAFRRVLIPQLRVPLAAVAILILVESVNELTLSMLLQPFEYGALSLRIYSYSGMQMLHEASLWMVCSIIICIYPVWSLSLWLDGSRQTHA